MSDLLTNFPALSVFFTCSIDGLSLGDWTSCSGLNITIATDDKADSSLSFHMTHQAKSVTFGHITLSRPISPATQQVVEWVQNFTQSPTPTTGALTALDQSGGTVISFTLIGVQPVKWTGPSFDSSSPKALQEQLELAFQTLQVAGS